MCDIYTVQYYRTLYRAPTHIHFTHVNLYCLMSTFHCVRIIENEAHLESTQVH
jgi:hypothetical protein